MKIKASSCHVFVLGMDMNCFMCGTIVRSGTHHHCKVEDKPAITPKKKVRKVKP